MLKFSPVFPCSSNFWYFGLTSETYLGIEWCFRNFFCLHELFSTFPVPDLISFYNPRFSSSYTSSERFIIYSLTFPTISCCLLYYLSPYLAVHSIILFVLNFRVFQYFMSKRCSKIVCFLIPFHLLVARPELLDWLGSKSVWVTYISFFESLWWWLDFVTFKTCLTW